MEEQSNQEVKQGWRFAADAASITTENASSEGCKHTSGGVFVKFDSDLGVVVDKEGAVMCLLGNEGGNAQTYVHVRRELKVFAVYFWHSGGCTPRNEALIEALVNRRGPLGPQRSKEKVHVRSTCRSAGPRGKLRS